MALSETRSDRRRTLRLLAGGALLPALAACKGNGDWAGIDVAGTLPDLAFTATRAGDGQTVRAADYRGQVTALFFGFTYCPDICPMTLANLSAVADGLGEAAAGLSILFVTVDPARDTAGTLAAYVDAFSPRATGLRCTDNQLAALGRRYRITYRVDPGDPYTVSHGRSVYVFDRKGAARVLLPDFDSAKADIAGVTEDMHRLLEV